MRPIYDATLDALEPLAGLALLDAGCGAGLALRLAADRGAAVSGLDASAPLLEVARDRTPQASLRTGDIQALPYDDAGFDVVTSFNAIQYAADPAAAVAQLARVCRPGGQVAVGVWGDPGRCQTEALFARLRSLAPPPPGTPAPLAVSDPGVVEGLLEKAGRRRSASATRITSRRGRRTSRPGRCRRSSRSPGRTPSVRSCTTCLKRTASRTANCARTTSSVMSWPPKSDGKQ
jgi:SAM-dependent methyltransferase